jgi:hypothetical protein
MTDAAAPAQPAAKDAIASLAAQLRHAGTGTLARLRRFDPIRNPQAALFDTERMLTAAGVQPHDAAHHQRWALVLHCMALAQGRHDMRFDADPGAVLARLQFSEARLRQLVEADGQVLATLMPRVGRRLAAAGATVNWWPLADLLLQGGPGDIAGRARADAARQRLVRRWLDAHGTSSANTASTATEPA